mmetsp:Transcript_19500/g.30969  ORF Transcript_19500/g.30969 Transcript_19500/m.30969 type:complete len:231 (-) Transcript_19500:254-946(-)
MARYNAARLRLNIAMVSLRTRLRWWWYDVRLTASFWWCKRRTTLVFGCLADESRWARRCWRRPFERPRKRRASRWISRASSKWTIRRTRLMIDAQPIIECVSFFMRNRAMKQSCRKVFQTITVPVPHSSAWMNWTRLSCARMSRVNGSTVSPNTSFITRSRFYRAGNTINVRGIMRVNTTPTTTATATTTTTTKAMADNSVTRTMTTMIMPPWTIIMRGTANIQTSMRKR